VLALALAKVGDLGAGGLEWLGVGIEAEELTQDRDLGVGITLGSCSSREAIAFAAARKRSPSASPRFSQRLAFSASTRSTISSARSRSAATVAVTSCEPSQRSKRAVSERTMPSTRRASASRPETFRSTNAWRSSMS